VEVIKPRLINDSKSHDWQTNFKPLIGLSWALFIGCLLYLKLNTQAFSHHFVFIAFMSICYVAYMLPLLCLKPTKRASTAVLFLYVFFLTSLNITSIFLLLANTPIDNPMFFLFFVVLFSSFYWFGLSFLLLSLAIVMGAYIVLNLMLGVDDPTIFVFHLLTLTIGSLMFIFASKTSKNNDSSLEITNHLHEGMQRALIATIVHDFRNVLTSVIGRTEVLSFEIKDESVATQLDDIVDAAEQGTEKTNQLSTLNAANTPKRNKVSLDLQACLSPIICFFHAQLPKHITLNVKIDPQLPEIEISAEELQQILVAVYQNAITSIQGKGEISIVISEKQKQDEEGKASEPFLNILVTDNGTGIEPENISHVTEHLWTTHAGEGHFGLGLTMVKRIVANRNGKLEITSQPNQGTQINMMFPKARGLSDF